ncbi:MAG TPA: hypothetical protein VGY55_08135 [Pirellulales bacterium]|jgi:hypothetical protein|nr:hypothetical protein [Pirellulales bacterium]
MGSSSDDPQTSPPRKKRRRWFQYRLRTLFLVMTAICVWLGWESHVVRQRKAALEEIKRSDGIVLSAADTRELSAALIALNAGKVQSGKDRAVASAFLWVTNQSAINTSIPFIREWLGDEAIASIALASKTSEDDVSRIATLFPEAHVGKPQYSSPIDSPQVR